MRMAFKIIAAACLMAGAQIAHADEVGGPPPGGCEGSEEGCGGGTPTPTPLPDAPGTGVGRSVSFFANPGNVVQGSTFYPAAGPTVFVFGDPNANRLLDDSLFQYGGSTSNVSFQFSTGAIPSALSTAFQADVNGRSSVDASLTYSVVLHAGTNAIADQLVALDSTGQFASAFGLFDLSATGSGHSTGVFGNRLGVPNTNSPFAVAQCDTGANAGGCGITQFNTNVVFIRGDQFADGISTDFYALVDLDAIATAGSPGLGHFPGGSSAYVDPKITINPSLTNLFNNLSLTINGVGNNTAAVAAVPEPATWLTMILGFGLLGGSMRRRAHKVRMARALTV